MGTPKEFVADVLEALEPLDVRARAMFGEYGMYCDEKFVAIIASSTLFLKPTPATADLPGAPPYPGAKDYRVVSGALLGDDAELRRLVQATADALPAKKPKN